MKLWTLQPLSVLDEIDTNGTYRCRKELSFNLSKKDSLEEKYHWLMERMEQRIGKAPVGVEYPIWAWHTWEGERQCPDINSAAFLKRTEDKVLFTLEIPETEVVLTDFDAWQTVLQNGYLTNETDNEKWKELEAYIDSLEGEQLRAAVEKSWENVFAIQKIVTEDIQRGCFVQATFWELRQEYVMETKRIPKE